MRGVLSAAGEIAGLLAVAALLGGVIGYLLAQVRRPASDRPVVPVAAVRHELPGSIDEGERFTVGRPGETVSLVDESRKRSLAVW